LYSEPRKIFAFGKSSGDQIFSLAYPGKQNSHRRAAESQEFNQTRQKGASAGLRLFWVCLGLFLFLF
jgi:hypothetical protein